MKIFAQGVKLLIKDMTIGNPGKTLFYFAVPMVLGNIFQQFYNIADSMIVGNFVGSDALAAVGASSSITFLFIAVATGMSIGSSVVISQLFGSGKIDKMKSSIYTIMISIFVLSLFLTVIGILFNNTILKLMNVPSNIFEDASIYLRIYFLGLVFLFMYNILTSTFNSLGNSKIPLVFLIFSSLLNIFLDLVFVLKFNMKVAGVAWATLISQAISAFLSIIVLLIKLRKIETEKKYSIFDFNCLKNICKIAIPSTIQQSIVSIGMIFVQSLVNSCGSIVVSGYTAATKIDNVAIQPMINVGSAVSNFTAQNIGAKKTDRINKGLKSALTMIACFALPITLALFIWGDIFVGSFVDSNINSDVIEVGVSYLKVVSLFYIVMGTMNNFNGVLRGSGDIKFFMTSTLCNFSSRVILAYALFPFFRENAIWYSIPIGWFVGLIISVFRFKSGKWKDKSVV